MALTETNFEILTAEVFKQEPTYVSGVPTATVGPPVTGSRVLNEIWKDALGGVFRCTVAGTPGTWKQMLPAAVTAGPSSGTVPAGYMIFNVTQGTMKRHARGYDWQTVIGATGARSASTVSRRPRSRSGSTRWAAVPRADAQEWQLDTRGAGGR